jgi:transposase
MSINRKPYPQAFRDQIVALVQAGRKPHELAQEFGCHVSSIHDWVGKAAVPAIPAASPLSPAERDELIKLRKQLKQVQMERDILAKATAWFAHHNVNPLE